MANHQASAPGIVHPKPPYTKADDEKLKAGLECYYPGCTSKFHSYGSLLTHVTNVRGFHRRSMKELRGTHLHDEGCKDINALQKARRRNPPKKRSDTKDPPEATEGKEGCNAKGNPAEPSNKRAKVKAEQADDEMVGEAEGTQWLPITCWIQCDSKGKPLEPLVCAGPCHSTPQPDCKFEGGGTQAPFAPFLNPGMAPQLLPPERPSSAIQVVPAKKQKKEEGPSGRLAIYKGHLDAQPPLGGQLHPMAMLQQIYNWAAKDQDKGAWKRMLPVVKIKEEILNRQPPPAKGELKANGEVCGRAEYPPDFEPDLEDEHFKLYLQEQKNKKGDNLTKYCQGYYRVLQAVEIVPNANHPDVKATDMEVLIALVAGNEHMTLLRSGLLSPKYDWTQYMMKGLAEACFYHKYRLSQKCTEGDEDAFPQFKDLLDRLVEDLNGGFKKKCMEHKAELLVEKHKKDLAVIKKFDKAVLQKAVAKAYIVLLQIGEKYQGVQKLPRNIQGLANACVAGAISFDTFSGRKKEWEEAAYEYVLSMLDQNSDHIVCSDHKTMKQYGSIAKVLTQGLLACLQLYAKLPRPEGFKYFFVPASANAEHFPFCTALKSFCRLFLGDDHVAPTLNQVRKWFHKALMMLTRDEDRLKEIFVVLDAHSKAVQGTHYILRDPEDDVKLGKQLIKTVLGETVTFPTTSQANQQMEEDAGLKAFIEELMASKSGEGDAVCDEDEEEEEYEEEMESWPAAKYFNVGGMECGDMPDLIPLMDGAGTGAPLEAVARSE